MVLQIYMTGITTLFLTSDLPGFTLSLKEYQSTIETLWQTTKDFMKEHPEHIAEGNSMQLISEDNGESYNLCHFVCLPHHSGPLMPRSWHSTNTRA